jgi:dienelactone hydrolase
VTAPDQSFTSPLTSPPLASRATPYEDLHTSLHGELYCDTRQPGPKPGVLLIHGGAGLDNHARDQARRYAELGYAVLACDMYGEGVAGDRERVLACVTALRDDPDLLVRRAEAGLGALLRCPEVTGPAAAIGYCFGGMAALALARGGADLAGVVSIHGSLNTTRPAEPDSVAATVLVCHGAADPHVPMSDVRSFVDEMNHANADWQLNIYGRAMHGFTHKHAVPGGTPGVAYDPAADQRSFSSTSGFLADVLAGPAIAGRQD